MPRTVEIERHSGFCGGVIRAIGTAERFLDAHPSRRLYSLGAIVHNEAELARLAAKGLVTVRRDASGNIPVPEKESLLIRAHGEPPQTYDLARKAGLQVIDCTCPVVLKLQESIREAYLGLQGKLLIFGKIGHAEVLGLLGQVDGDAIVIENMDMLQAALEDGTIPTDVPLEIFSQTTKDPLAYAAICEGGVKVHRTICSQVASRHKELSAFARAHDVILFVAGVSSSNGKVLCDLCRSRNPRTHHISSPEEIDPAWFGPGERIGICGATSTPRWLLERTAAVVAALPE